MLNLINNNDIKIFEEIIDLMVKNKEKFDIRDRKLFERKETTDNLKDIINDLIEKYSGKNENLSNTNQINLFD